MEGKGREAGTPQQQWGPWPCPCLAQHHPLPSPAPFLAELVVIVLILHPLQPKPGKVLKHDVIICGIA